MLATREHPTAPHPVKAVPEQLGADLCMRCHEASATLTDTLVCRFTTGEEWLRSPAREEGKTCVTSHMARPGGAPTGRRSHRFTGMGLAKKAADQAVVQFHYVPGLDILLKPERDTVRPGEVVRVEIVVANARAGHELPAGDVDASSSCT